MTTRGRDDPSLDTPRCTAHSSRTGLPCKHYPVNGSNVCFSHGGNAPQVKRKPRERIENAADRMARKLLEMASDTTVSEAVRLAAIRDALDRAVIAPRTLDLSVGPKAWEQVFDSMDTGA